MRVAKSAPCVFMIMKKKCHILLTRVESGPGGAPRRSKMFLYLRIANGPVKWLYQIQSLPRPTAPPPGPHKTARGRAPTASVPPHVESPRLSSARHSALSALTPAPTARSAEAQMLDLLRPVSTCAPAAADRRASLCPGVTRAQKRGRGGVWGGVLCRSQQNLTNVGGDAYDEDDFSRRLRLVTSRVLVADACPSGGGRGQLRRSPFPSLMRLRHPGV